jgi:hypothetical protein
MKKPVFLILTMSLLLAFTKTSTAQQIIKTDKEIYSIDGAYNFIITKSDINTKKVLFKAETKIPDKSQKKCSILVQTMLLLTLLVKTLLLYMMYGKNQQVQKIAQLNY